MWRLLGDQLCSWQDVFLYCIVLITEVTICMKLQGENAVNFIEAAF